MLINVITSQFTYGEHNRYQNVKNFQNTRTILQRNYGQSYWHWEWGNGATSNNLSVHNLANFIIISSSENLEIHQKPTGDLAAS